jgi:hypothetical protein
MILQMINFFCLYLMRSSQNNSLHPSSLAILDHIELQHLFESILDPLLVNHNYFSLSSFVVLTRSSNLHCKIYTSC